MSNIRSAINELKSHSDLSDAYALMKRRSAAIDIEAAQDFRINQTVKFQSEKDGVMRGKISNIGRTGRVKVTLIDSRWDSYTMGGAFLKENLL